MMMALTTDRTMTMVMMESVKRTAMAMQALSAMERQAIPTTAAQMDPLRPIRPPMETHSRTAAPILTKTVPYPATMVPMNHLHSALPEPTAAYSIRREPTMMTALMTDRMMTMVMVESVRRTAMAMQALSVMER